MQSRPPIRNLVPWLLFVGAFAVLASLASREAGTFYAQLARPAWAPPAAIFGPVWSALYVLMAVAAWLTIAPLADHRKLAGLFVAQLAVNALWSWLFFSWKMGGAAFFDILLLIALVIATMVGFARRRRLAAVLMAPYLLWICFAAALNWSVWRMNPQLLG
ncbi:TspO/MBR family protein [Ramlibacter sp.]|uniref:TspO/MBR family protein n=1 Tax=Ramlibacter sp. TaxID=1917967 RepID=UPI003D0D378E